MPKDYVRSKQIGAPPDYKREVLLMDDFDGSMNWSVSGTGAGYGAEHIEDAAYFGEKGLHLYTRPADCAVGDICTIEKYIDYPITDLLVFRARIGIPVLDTVGTFLMVLDIYDGTTRNQAVIRYEPFYRYMYYLDISGEFLKIDGYRQYLEDGFWTTFEYAIDCSTKEYIYVLFNGIKTDLTGIRFDVIGATTSKRAELWIRVTTRLEEQTSLYLDALYAGELEHI